MAAEARRNERSYFYKKRCEGNRVISEYVGGGQLVVLAEHQAQIERERKQREREEVRAARISMAEIDARINEFSKLVDTLIDAYLLTLGYHKHKRQWRRRRNG